LPGEELGDLSALVNSLSVNHTQSTFLQPKLITEIWPFIAQDNYRNIKAERFNVFLGQDKALHLINIDS